MRIGHPRRVLAGSLAGAAVVAGLLLSGASAGRLSPTALTPTERNALRIVSVRAAGAEGGGLVVTVTFGGNLEKAIGRGHLKTALVAVILRPKDAQFSTTDLATEGAGPIGLTSKKSRSEAVGVVRNGRTFTFFIAGPGSSNVGRVVVKAFVSPPGRKPARTTAGTTVSPDQWEKIENDIGFAELFATVDEAIARLPADCAALRRMYDRVLANLARARIRELELQDLRKQIDADIARVETKVGRGADFAIATAHTIYAPIGLAIALVSGKTPAQTNQSWKDLLRSLKLDRKLADAYIARNQKLIDNLNQLKGRLEGLHKAMCNDAGTTPLPAGFKVGLRTSYTHPGGSTSTFCVLVTTTPAKPGASAKVHVSGPGVVGSADQTTTLDAAGGALVNVTINAYGTYMATATVTDGGAAASSTDSKEVKPAQATCPPP